MCVVSSIYIHIFDCNLVCQRANMHCISVSVRIFEVHAGHKLSLKPAVLLSEFPDLGRLPPLRSPAIRAHVCLTSIVFEAVQQIFCPRAAISLAATSRRFHGPRTVCDNTRSDCALITDRRNHAKPSARLPYKGRAPSQQKCKIFIYLWNSPSV